jgi:hypothetical protein
MKAHLQTFAEWSAAITEVLGMVPIDELAVYMLL